MSDTLATPKTRPARPFRDIPSAGVVSLLRNLLGNGGGRIDMLGAWQQQYQKYGPVVSQLPGPVRMVNLIGPDANRLVLMDRERIFSARRPWMRIMGKIFPNGLLLMDGDEHDQHRKIMHETFKRPVLRDYARSMNPKIAEGIAGWAEQGNPLLAFGAFKELTLDMAASIFLGVELGPGSRRMNHAFEDMVAASMSRVRLPLPGLEFKRGLDGRRFMIDYLGRMISGRRAKGGRDTFSRLCSAEGDAGSALADQEVIDHMIFLMMAAHDTTTSTLTSMTYELARHPQWQERVREESLALDVDHPDFDDLEKLRSLSLVMKETLRRYPPLPVIPRICTEAFEFGGYRIPARSLVVVSPIHTHYMAEWWDEPDRFDPERFAAGRTEDQRHTHSWIPFGGGPHMCLGRRFAEAQVRLIMHQLVRRHRWSVPEGYRMPVQQAPISKPLDGLPIELRPLS